MCHKTKPWCKELETFRLTVKPRTEEYLDKCNCDSYIFCIIFGVALDYREQYDKITENRSLLSWSAIEYADCIPGRGVRILSSKKGYHEFNTKLHSDGEAPVLQLQGMWSSPSMSLLPDPLWPRVVANVRVKYISHKLFVFGWDTWCYILAQPEYTDCISAVG